MSAGAPTPDSTKAVSKEDAKAASASPAASKDAASPAETPKSPVTAATPVSTTTTPAGDNGSSSKAAETPTPATSASAASAEVDHEPADDEPLPDEPDGIINMEIFSQIQDMDDEDDEDEEGGGHEFSKGIVWGYFEQAENTFKSMEEAIAEPSLSKLSSLGHFLKGSSAALGIIKLQDSCEKMQHYGNLRDEEVGAPLTEEEALKRIKALLADCKRDYAVASRWLRRLYGENV
ncbi:Phosphorelay intermediate protein [Vanrija albida]|uniref:Phosphorelay intermediate protein n=1 Tax=Vanrija albida TaxID=181172 RepID=A0ABR3Q7I0_9TREE